MRNSNSGVVQRAIRYAALPSQKLFHQATARIKGFSGPIGSGKSQALCQEAVRLAYTNAGRQGLIGAPTFPMLRDATQRALFEVLETNRIPFEFNKSENAMTFLDTGSKVIFRSMDEFERLRGTNLAWFGIDELSYCEEEAWLRLEGRLRDPKAKQLCGFAVWTPKGFDWVYRRFISERVEGYFVVRAKPMENRHLLDHVPDFYERLRHSYDERFFQQEVLGEYLNITAGQAYHAFSRPVHVRPCSFQPNRPVFWALDFNVDPMSSVVVQLHGDEVHVIDEISLSRATTEQACEEFWARYKTQRDLTVFGDASGNQMKTSGLRDRDTISSFFRRCNVQNFQLHLPPTNPLIRERVQLVNAMLANARGETRLYVDPRCKELIKDLEEVLLQPGTQVIDKLRDPKRTHMSDALGYLLWQVQEGQRPVGPRNRPLF